MRPSPIAPAIGDPLLEDRQRLRVDVPIGRHDAERAQAACELSLQLPRAQDRKAARGELLGCRVVPESGADGDPVHRRRQRDGARASGVFGVETCRASEQLERLGPVEPAVHEEERVEGIQHRQRHALVVLGHDPLGRSAKIVQLAPEFVPCDRELRAHECRLPLRQHGRVVTGMALVCILLLDG